MTASTHQEDVQISKLKVIFKRNKRCSCTFWEKELSLAHLIGAMRSSLHSSCGLIQQKAAKLESWKSGSWIAADLDKMSGLESHPRSSNPPRDEQESRNLPKAELWSCEMMGF